MVKIDERDGLAVQDKDNLDLENLAADTPEVISRQVLNPKFKFSGQVSRLGNDKHWHNRSRSAWKIYSGEGNQRPKYDSLQEGT